MFSQLGLSPTACASLARLGYITHPIQTDAIPLVLRGVDLLARAQTGTGKAAAFGVPMIERLMKRDKHLAGRLPRGLVLVPTRELAVERKRDALTHVLTQHGAGQALVFCRTKRGANRVGDDLGPRGVRTGVIHGNKSQSARTRALTDFKSGCVRVLVATDIADRGLDIAHLPLVVNFDLPLVPEDYVHRVGRTGRAGQPGRAVSLVTASEAGLLRQIQRVVAAPIEHVALPAAQLTATSRNVDGSAPVHQIDRAESLSVRQTPRRRNRPHTPRQRAARRRGISVGRWSATS